MSPPVQETWLSLSNQLMKDCNQLLFPSTQKIIISLFCDLLNSIERNTRTKISSWYLSNQAKSSDNFKSHFVGFFVSPGETCGSPRACLTILTQFYYEPFLQPSGKWIWIVRNVNKAIRFEFKWKFLGMTVPPFCWVWFNASHQSAPGAKPSTSWRIRNSFSLFPKDLIIFQISKQRKVFSRIQKSEKICTLSALIKYLS